MGSCSIIVDSNFDRNTQVFLDIMQISVAIGARKALSMLIEMMQNYR